MERHGANDAMLGAPMCTENLRKVLDECLNATRDLMETAQGLPALLCSRRLAMESAVIINMARELIAELAGRDPLKAKVRLSKGQYAMAMLKGIWHGLRRDRRKQ